MKSVIAFIKLFIFALLCLAVIPAQALVLWVSKGKASYILPNLWHKAMCKNFGIKLEIHGQVLRAQQAIYVSNHLSYLDIIALGGVLHGSFVAKKDVKDWPVFGFLSKLQQTAFISRDRYDAVAMTNNLENLILSGKSMIIFPEGTSTDGKSVYPFKSSLFSIFLKDNIKNIPIQPITIQMIKTNGQEIASQEDRDLYAWHINMDTPLHEHLWRFAKSSGAILSVTFHPPIYASHTNNRKILAKHCHDAVCNGLKNNKVITKI